VEADVHIGVVEARNERRYSPHVADETECEDGVVSNVGIVEIDLATNRVTRTIPQLPDPTVPLEDAGVLWATDMDRSELWRIVP